MSNFVEPTNTWMFPSDKSPGAWGEPAIFNPRTNKNERIIESPLYQQNAINFLENFIKGGESYSQSSTNSPPISFARDYEGGYGTDIPPYYRESISASPSFDLGYPKIPGRNVEGIPNANDPIMREKLRQRLLRNPDGGQELPGFLKKA